MMTANDKHVELLDLLISMGETVGEAKAALARAEEAHGCARTGNKARPAAEVRSRRRALDAAVQALGRQRTRTLALLGLQDVQT